MSGERGKTRKSLNFIPELYACARSSDISLHDPDQKGPHANFQQSSYKIPERGSYFPRQSGRLSSSLLLLLLNFSYYFVSLTLYIG